jgi:hypothetical protein
VSLLGRRRKDADSTDQVEDHLLTRPAPAWSEFRGAEIIDAGAILRWRTEYGTIGVVYSVPFEHHSVHRFVNQLREKYGWQLHEAYASLVSAEHTMGWYGPDLQAVDIYKWGKVSDSYEPISEELAKIIGSHVPIWHSNLRLLETIKTWKPGSPPAIVPAFENDHPIEPFLALAADEPVDSLVTPVCMWLARTIRDRSTEEAKSWIEMLKDVSKDYGDKWFTFGALPAEIRRPEAEELPEEIRRGAWAQILDRRDELSAEVVKLASMWDGGKDWQAGATAQIRPNAGGPAAQWAARLVPAPRDQAPTAFERVLLPPVEHGAVDGALLQDPETEMPAVYFYKGTPNEYVATKVPLHIPTTNPLKSVILSEDIVWIVTRDDRLWIAPAHPGLGLNWGYEGGSGPYTLAKLLEVLLDEIISPAVDSFQPPPRPGLRRLLENTPQHGTTTYTREQLAKARDEPPTPDDREWFEDGD